MKDGRLSKEDLLEAMMDWECDGVWCDELNTIHENCKQCMEYHLDLFLNGYVQQRVDIACEKLAAATKKGYKPITSIVQCSKCGQKIYSDMKYCDRCGAETKAISGRYHYE